jgi:hypothetical protein
VVLDMLADSADAAPAQLLQLLSDPQTASERLRGDDIGRLFTNAYRELITLPSAPATASSFRTWPKMRRDQRCGIAPPERTTLAGRRLRCCSFLALRKRW